jgi:hypothetical protein
MSSAVFTMLGVQMREASLKRLKEGPQRLFRWQGASQTITNTGMLDC